MSQENQDALQATRILKIISMGRSLRSIAQEIGVSISTLCRVRQGKGCSVQTFLRIRKLMSNGDMEELVSHVFPGAPVLMDAERLRQIIREELAGGG